MGDAGEVAALRNHATRRRLDGFPLYAGDDEDAYGFIDEPEWEWANLTPRQRREVELDAAALALGRNMTDDQAMDFMLGEFGIACPHRWDTHEPTHRECRMCRAWEQLPGRVVRVGGRKLRVLDPPPRVLRIPVAVSVADYTSEPVQTPADAGPEIEEYEWTGHAYVKIAPS